MSISDDALAVLLGEDLGHVVDLVLRETEGVVEAHAREGSVGFTRDGVAWIKGRNPLERQDLSAFTPLETEHASLRPAQHENVYPFAYDNAAQIFDDARAPDLAVVHTPAHNWEERGGHRGEHGSLDLVQSRAPLILAGAGVRHDGPLDRAARMVDIAPTLAAMLGLHDPLPGSPGRALEDLIESIPKHVVAFLWDGTNANVLYAMADAGELPNVARLMSAGTTFTHGCISSFPSVTLANHTTAVTGCHPGAHGVLNNFYFDRATGQQVVANSPETWHLARDKISTEVATIFEAAAREGGGFTAAVNEPCDRGASYATFDVVRAYPGMITDSLPAPDDLPGTTKAFLGTREYAWSSAADHMAVAQAMPLWSGANGNPRPSLMWINLILPDAANHAGGPYSDIGHAGLRDTDARMGEILQAMDWGAGDTAFVIFADHGMEESDPACTGDFDEALVRAGIPFRDEGYGFIYLDP